MDMNCSQSHIPVLENKYKAHLSMSHIHQSLLAIDSGNKCCALSRYRVFAHASRTGLGVSGGAACELAFLILYILYEIYVYIYTQYAVYMYIGDSVYTYSLKSIHPFIEPTNPAH